MYGDEVPLATSNYTMLDGHRVIRDVKYTLLRVHPVLSVPTMDLYALHGQFWNRKARLHPLQGVFASLNYTVCA